MDTASAGFDTARLAEAFNVFNQASEELASAYGALERQVESLTAELAAANAEADRLREEAERNKRLAAMGEMAAQLAHQLLANQLADHEALTAISDLFRIEQRFAFRQET